jgi:hypothetical protein
VKEEEKSMKAEQKLARQRLSVLELAEALGNVSEACSRRGISRTRFYEYKRRFQTHGIKELKDLPPVPKSHPMSTHEGIQQRIIQLSLSHPTWAVTASRTSWRSWQGLSSKQMTGHKGSYGSS